MNSLPASQHAVQLVGPDQLTLNHEKPVQAPTGYQMLCRVESTGLCFSDLKLLKQFGEHPRKGAIVSGATPDMLDGNASYVPGEKPTVPGHEAVVRIVAVGDAVTNHRVGERCLVQTDYRHLPTANSNAAFGYNLEGGLQEYVLIDERISTDPATGERFLIPVSEERSASAICLVEPWACVESSYRNPERQGLKPAGNLLLVVDAGREIKGVKESFGSEAPAALTIIGASDAQLAEIDAWGIPLATAERPEDLPERAFDDIVYFGASRGTIEALNGLLADRATINVVTNGALIGEPVDISLGRIHYGMTRWVGTCGDDAAEGYTMIPEAGEVRNNDRIYVMGAGGPMGQMHVIRNICSGAEQLVVVASDLDRTRLEGLNRLAEPSLERTGATLAFVVPGEDDPGDDFSYVVVMAPLPQLVTEAVARSGDGAIVNIFAGIPAGTIAPLDLDAVIQKRCFLFGTSGSLLSDMKVVLEKVESGQLDTNVSVAAISGMEGAVEGIRAVEARSIDGKIVVYPPLIDLGLVTLDNLASVLPHVAAKLVNGQWNRDAEAALLGQDA